MSKGDGYDNPVVHRLTLNYVDKIRVVDAGPGRFEFVFVAYTEDKQGILSRHHTVKLRLGLWEFAQLARMMWAAWRERKKEVLRGIEGVESDLRGE